MIEFWFAVALGALAGAAVSWLFIFLKFNGD